MNTVALSQFLCAVTLLRSRLRTQAIQKHQVQTREKAKRNLRHCRIRAMSHDVQCSWISTIQRRITPSNFDCELKHSRLSNVFCGVQVKRSANAAWRTIGVDLPIVSSVSQMRVAAGLSWLCVVRFTMLDCATAVVAIHLSLLTLQFRQEGQRSHARVIACVANGQLNFAAGKQERPRIASRIRLTRRKIECARFLDSSNGSTPSLCSVTGQARRRPLPASHTQLSAE